MRTLNVRLAAICLVVTVVLGGGVHLLHGFQVRRQADAFRIASQRAEEDASRTAADSGKEKDLTDAIRLLRSYLSLVPKDHKEQLRLGMLYADEHQLQPRPYQAFVELEAVLRAAEDLSNSDDKDFSPTPEELRTARHTLAKMAILYLGRPTDAEKHLQELMKDTPDDPELLVLCARALIAKKQDEEACKKLRQAIKNAPTQMESYVLLASDLRLRLNRTEEADKVMQDMVSRKDEKGNVINAKSVKAFQAYADYLRGEGKYDEALAQTKHILELAPEDAVGLQIAGTCYLAKGQYKTAEDYLNRGIKADKGRSTMYVLLFEAKNHLGRHDEAVGTLRQGLENTKGTNGYVDVLWALVSTNISDGKLDEATKGIKEMRELHFFQERAPQRVEFLAARLAMAKGDWKVAKETFSAVLPKLHDDRDIQKTAYLSLSQCYRQQGDIEREIVALTESLKIDPYLSPARARLADIFLGRGNFAEASEHYRQLAKAPHADPEVAFALARTLIMSRVVEDKGKRDWEPVDKLLDQIQQQRSLTPSLAVLKAEVALAKDNFTEAESILKQCAVQAPKSAQIWMALINLATHQADHEADPVQKEKLWKQVADTIDQAEKNLGDHPMVREKRGGCAVLRNDPQASAVLKKLGENLDKMSDGEKTHLWENLAALSVQANDLDLARHYRRLVAKQEPNNILIRYLLCDLILRAYEKGQSPDLQELDKLLSEIKQVGGEGGPYWLYGEAIRKLVQSKKTDAELLVDAQHNLRKAMEIRKDWAAPAVLAGKICELLGEPDQAMDFYVRAVYRMGERDSDVIRRTVQLLLPRGRIEEAKQLVDYLEKQKSPILGKMNREYVYVKVFTGDITEAERDVERSIPAGSQKYEDFLRQGQLFGHLAQRLRLKAENDKRDWKSDAETLRMTKRAEDSLLKARSLNPQVDEVWFALVRLLVSMDQSDKAKPLVAEAEASLKGERAPITLAMCCDLLNETEKAQAKYDEAAKAAPQNSRVLRQVAAFYMKNNKLDRAEPLLKQIVALQSPATLIDACWARRSLASILLSRGHFDQLCQGLALIDENLHGKAASTDDLRTKMRLLVADPRKEKIGEAIQTMEYLVTNSNATPEDYFTLAGLYLKKGDWNEFTKGMQGVLGAQKGAVQPQYVASYINALLEKKEFDDADVWLKTLEKTVPDLFGTVRLRAEYQFLRGNHKAAGDLIMGFLDNPNAQPKDRGQQLFLVGQVMENFSDRLKVAGKADIARDFGEKTETLYASVRSKVSSAGDIVFAAYLARQKRFQECLDLLEQCWDKYPAATLQAPAVVMIRSKAASTAQYQQLEKILVAAANKAKRPTVLLAVLADLHAQQREDNKSIADYREILAKDPQNFGAMNNLGLALARTGQNLDEALNLVNGALAIRGPMAEVLDSRALVFIARQEPEKALEDLAAAIKDDGSAEQYFHQAWAYSLAGKKAEAAAAFAVAVKKGLDPKDLDPREVSVYDRLKDAL